MRGGPPFRGRNGPVLAAAAAFFAVPKEKFRAAAREMSKIYSRFFSEKAKKLCTMHFFQVQNRALYTIISGSFDEKARFLAFLTKL